MNVTQSRPWYGEARARPVWVSVGVERAVRVGETLALEIEAGDGAEAALWGGAATGATSLRGDALCGEGDVELMRIEAYRPSGERAPR